MKLQEQKCRPCSGETKPLSYEEAKTLQKEIPQWDLKDYVIERTFKFKDFKEAIGFVNNIAATAEEEGHHPDIHIFYNKVRLELTTHKINGLSQNDFILASKIDMLAEPAVIRE